jgi:hypothetical protein
MMVSKVIICPICGKKTFLRIQDGGYLDEYPIRVNCFNCRALMKGTYIMTTQSPYRGLFMLNADVEECDMEVHGNDATCKNADYVAEVSGELPCGMVKEYKGGVPLSPFMRATDHLDSTEKHIDRLKYFNSNMAEWKRKKSTAFQLLDDGSIDYISTALGNKMGDFPYECDNYLKSIHCLQEVVLEETKDLFLTPNQDDYVRDIIREMASIDKDKLHELSVRIGGVQDLLLAYRKNIEIFSEFMGIYANILPAETYMNFTNKDTADSCIATCSFIDIKTFYQDAYESLLSLLYIPVCLDNITVRGDYQSFSTDYDSVFCPAKMSRNFKWYKGIDNGTRINKLNRAETFLNLIGFPADRLLRNGIGHNNIQYDSITQEIKAFDLKRPNKVNYQGRLMDVAVDCLGLAKTSVVFSEMILFMMRREFRLQGVHSSIHPRFYKGVQPNDRCPCGSGLKYKQCCRNDLENMIRSKAH